MLWFYKILVTFSSVEFIFNLHSEGFIFGKSCHILQKLSPEPILQLFKSVLPRLLHPKFPKIFEDKSPFFNLWSHHVLLIKLYLFVIRAFMIYGYHW